MKLADFLRSSDRIDEAIEQYELALEIRIEGRMPRTHRYFIRNVRELAGLLEDLGLTGEAARVRSELR